MIGEIAVGLAGWTLVSIVFGLGAGRWLRRRAYGSRTSAAVQAFQQKVA